MSTFLRRNRASEDMEYLIATCPQLLGIGIDETTAIVVQKSVAEVVGRGKVASSTIRRKRRMGK